MNEKAFQKFLATGEYAIAEDAAAQGPEQQSPAMIVEEEEMETVSDAADKYLALDEKPMTDLQKHDKRFHKNGYKEGDACKYREALARGDDADKLKEAEKEEKQTTQKKNKDNYVSPISLSGALPFPDLHFVVKEPGSREVMMSDGTFKPYEKLSGWDHPLMTTKEHAEEVAKEKGGAAVSDKYLRDTDRWYWIRDNDRVLNSYSAWGPTRYEFENLGNLDNNVFKTNDLDFARKIAAEHGGEVEPVPPSDKWDYKYDRRVYEGYEDVKPQQAEEQKAVQEKLQPKIDAILKKHDVPCEEAIILGSRSGSGDEFSISLIGKMDKDAQSTPDYIYLREASDSKTIDALRDISKLLAKNKFRDLEERYDSLDTLMWKKEKLDDGTLVFHQDFSSPEYIRKYKQKYH